MSDRPDPPPVHPRPTDATTWSGSGSSAGDGPWWQTGVVYQIYPRSFADGNGDGVGDLAGVIGHLDHVAALGVDAIWLSPIYPSPMADFGYDVSDFCGVDPIFGSLADLDRLVAEAHARHLRVILDWVPNHTSDRHPWFVESRSSRDNPKRDWYVWRDRRPDGSYPTNWIASLRQGIPAWTLDPSTGQYYLHCFLPAQPDLNWDNPEVERAMHDTLRFWLDRGIDGFRADVVHLIGKDYADDPPAALHPGISHVPFNDAAVTHERLERIRGVLEAYTGDRMMVGEVYLLDARRMASYVGPTKLHLSFNFSFLWAPWDADTIRNRIDTALGAHADHGGWPTWVLSNHDVVRHRQRHGGSEERARSAAVVLLGLRGTPFLYQGEELGLVDADVPPDRQVDPGGRDGCRAPIPWEPDAGHGWPTDPWLPFPPEAATRAAAVQAADPASTMTLYRRLLALRRARPALHAGTQTWLESPAGVLAWERRQGTDRVWVVVNLGTDEAVVDLPGPATVLAVSAVGADDPAGSTFGGRVASDRAYVLDPGPALPAS